MHNVECLYSMRTVVGNPSEPGFEQGSLEAFLDEVGIGNGPAICTPIGDGHSNLTYLVVRGSVRVVLRRPPRGKLAPSTHDVVREARLLKALRGTGVKVPEILAINSDPTVIGCPFFLMTFVEGVVIGEKLPSAFETAEAMSAIGDELVDALVDLHGVKAGDQALEGFGRPAGYLERQLRRFGDLMEANMTRPLPDLEVIADWLVDNRPASPPATLVHGDYRLGNVLFSGAIPRVTAVLDWEMATTGDPLADLGYCMMAWAEPGDEPNPVLDLSATTRLPGMPRRRELVRRYAGRSGADVTAEGLAWYQVLAAWKAAIFLEGNYRRHLAGDSDDLYLVRLGDGVPALARQARRWASV